MEINASNSFEILYHIWHQTTLINQNNHPCKINGTIQWLNFLGCFPWTQARSHPRALEAPKLGSDALPCRCGAGRCTATASQGDGWMLRLRLVVISMVYSILFIGFYTPSQRWLALGFLNHQQYDKRNTNMTKEWQRFQRLMLFRSDICVWQEIAPLPAQARQVRHVTWKPTKLASFYCSLGISEDGINANLTATFPT